MARTSSHFFESWPSFAADSHCFRKNIENVSQSEACADGQIMLLLLLFFIIILDEDEDENEEEEEEEEEEGEIIALTGTEVTRAAIIFRERWCFVYFRKKRMDRWIVLF